MNRPSQTVSGDSRSSTRDELIRELGMSPETAHQLVFKHRHPDATPDFHYDIINVWHSPHPYAQVMAFREAGKSTIAEEAIVLGAIYGDFANAILIGENQPRAIDRLTAIKHELMHNEVINDLFGNQVGEVWGMEKIVLRNGVVIQALGRRQEVRGMKHLDKRPDILFGDDLEGEEHVKDAEVRHETLRWLFGEVIPALDKNHRVRIQATPLDREALPMTLAGLPDWHTLRVPIKFRDPATGEWRASWPARYPLEWIDRKEVEMQRLGLHHEFMREYMCEAEDPTHKLFTSSMFKVVPRTHVWQPVFAMYDPARTTNERSSTTGYAAWSWVGNRLIVWEGDGLTLKPDEIVKHVFELNARFRPVTIGVERDGLEEFIMQPLRHEMIKRGAILPIEPHRAPRGKIDFIGGLQPLFNAGEVEFAKPLPGMFAQLMAYPTGKIDAPNALAYALLMRPGVPIYEDFAHNHVTDAPLRFEEAPFYLALNATASITTAVLVQQFGNILHILADFIREGDPGSMLESILKDAKVAAGTKVKAIAPLQHFESYDVIGLRGAAASIPIELQRGGAELEGRAAIREYLTKQVKGLPAFLVASDARWTLNALAAGFCREVTAAGVVKETPKPGIYAVLMKGLEAFAGLLKIGMLEEAQPANWAHTASGVAYKTILPQRGEHAKKSDWISGADRVNDLRRFKRGGPG